jgi:N-acetylglutamate synthase
MSNRVRSKNQVETIRLIEELAMNAWPAETIQIVDGWRLRFNHGVTRRTNSVWPNEWGGRMTFEARMTIVEAFFERRGLPARFQVCPAGLPADLDERLAGLGYEVEAETMVQTASIEQVLAKTGTDRPCRIIEGADRGWFAAYERAAGLDEHAARVRWATIARTGPRHAYALLELEGQAVAVGRGVVERGWLGIFGMSTHPDFRRLGCATAVLGALAEWGRSQGATRVYLQVELHNRGAQALYAGMGFETLYHYYYRSLGL